MSIGSRQLVLFIQDVCYIEEQNRCFSYCSSEEIQCEFIMPFLLSIQQISTRVSYLVVDMIQARKAFAMFWFSCLCQDYENRLTAPVSHVSLVPLVSVLLPCGSSFLDVIIEPAFASVLLTFVGANFFYSSECSGKNKSTPRDLHFPAGSLDSRLLPMTNFMQKCWFSKLAFFSVIVKNAPCLSCIRRHKLYIFVFFLNMNLKYFPKTGSLGSRRREMTRIPWSAKWPRQNCKLFSYIENRWEQWQFV